MHHSSAPTGHTGARNQLHSMKTNMEWRESEALDLVSIGVSPLYKPGLKGGIITDKDYSKEMAERGRWRMWPGAVHTAGSIWTTFKSETEQQNGIRALSPAV